MKSRLLTLILLVLFFLTSPVYATSQLVKLTRSDSKNKILLFFTFDHLPKYNTKVSGKRVDITFEDTKNSDGIQLFPADTRIVKILPPETNHQNTFTLFLRYPPQKITSKEQENIIVFEILPGTTYSRDYGSIFENLNGATIVKRETADYSNPFITSPYAHNWKSFFTQYEAPVSISLAVKFTPPPFPIARLLPDSKDFIDNFFTEEIQIFAEQELWGVILTSLQEKIASEKDPEIKKQLALTLGEVLLRIGNFDSAFKQLYVLEQKYKNEQTGIFASYLLSLLRGSYEDTFIGNVMIDELAKDIHPKSRLMPYYYLSKIEFALATGQLEKMKHLLQKDDIGFPDPIDKIRELRQYDYFYATNNLVKSYVGYQLLQDETILNSHPFSLNNYCSLLYQQKQYDNASTCYGKLLVLTDNKDSLSMISFRKAMSDLKSQPLTSVLNSFSTIEDAYPGTDAAFKAAIKKVDLMAVSKDKWDDFSAKYYRALADKSVTKDTSEEARLKEAINYAIMGNTSKSVDLTMAYLRNYRSGKLTQTGQALLIDQLPKEIKKLIDKQEYMKVLVLAKKNKTFFANNWIDIKLLADVAESFTSLGIYKEAQRLYVYLLDSFDDQNREPYYLPLIKLIFIQGDYDLIEDYAAQYFYTYPDGKDRKAIEFLLLQSLFKEKKYKQALDRLPAPLPQNIEFTIFLGSLYYHTNNFSKVIDTLQPLWDDKTLTEPMDIFILGDSLFNTKRYAEAAPILLSLLENDPKNQQLLYQMSKIKKYQGEKEQSLKFLQLLVETEGDSPWKTAAIKELEFETFVEDFKKTKNRL